MDHRRQWDRHHRTLLAVRRIGRAQGDLDCGKLMKSTLPVPFGVGLFQYPFDPGGVDNHSERRRGIFMQFTITRRRIGTTHVCHIDDEDAEKLAGRTWRIHPSRHSVLYVVAGDGPSRARLHNVIGGALPPGYTWDHINGDGLDNRKANLRPATHAQQGQNHRSHGDSASVFRGVYWYAASRKWQAQCKLNGKKYHLGYFEDEAEAGAVAAAFRSEHMPFAVEGR